MLRPRGKQAVAAETLYVEDVCSAYVYTGTGSALSIVNGINLATYGGMVWTKQRDAAGDHALYDTARGATFDLTSTSTAAQTTQAQGVTAFNSNGYSVGTLSRLNSSSAPFVSWTFRKAAKFFDVVTYTGNATNRTISHSLGAVPGMIIIKKTSGVGNWAVYHRSLANTQYLELQATNAVATGADYWNSTTATASDFSLGTNNTVNQNGQTYVAYIFGHDTTSDGIIQCGTFTTDVSGNATVSLGWEPQFLQFKRTDNTGNWFMYDTSRGWNLSASTDRQLISNGAAAEQDAAGGNPTATGFAVTSLSASATYVYMTIRKGLMRTPTDATKVFAINVSTGTGAIRTLSGSTITTGIDLFITKCRATSGHWNWQDRLRGTVSQLASSTNGAEGADTDAVTAFNMDGVTLGADASSLRTNVSGRAYETYFLKQARGFMDEVAYTGTGSAHTEAHNLGAVPELMIVKSRSDPLDWAVYYGVSTNYILLNSTAATAASSAYWNNTNPTSSVFSVGTNTAVNKSSATHVAYLFATLAGVSKVGTYTGNATTNQINCGFAAGARLVLIKRVDSTGDWYVWDATWGIVSGNDPYLLMNSNVTGVTTTDYIDPYSAGFEISSTAPAAINASGGTFMFLAIA